VEKVVVKKWLANFLIGLTVFLAACLILHGTIAQILFTNAVQKATGVSIRVRELHANLLKGVIKIKGLQLLNPRDFPEKMLADIPELYVNMDLKALLQGKIHLEEIVLNLDQLIILRNSEGKLNLSSLKPVQEPSTPLTPLTEEDKEAEKRGGNKKNFQLDYLRLSVGRVYYRDYRAGDLPPSREYPIEIQNAEYRDISDPDDLIRQILAQALAMTAFAELGDLEAIQRRLLKNLERAGSSMKEKSQEVLKEAVETLNALQLIKKKPTETEEQEQQPQQN